MIRLFVIHPLAAGIELRLGPEQSHYLVNVMRQAIGARIALFNGRDGEWAAELIQTPKKAALLVCRERLREQAPPLDVELVAAVVKRSRLETIVEKAAELGADRVRPVFTERTNADRVNRDRLQAIAVEAAEQTGRLDVPQIAEPVKLKALIEAWDENRALLFCDEAGDAPPLLDAVEDKGERPWAILIGPEGGFSPEERARLRAMPQAIPVGLGPRILRADTAAIAALTLWQSALGDWRV